MHQKSIWKDYLSVLREASVVARLGKSRRIETACTSGSVARGMRMTSGGEEMSETLFATVVRREGGGGGRWTCREVHDTFPVWHMLQTTCGHTKNVV